MKKGLEIMRATRRRAWLEDLMQFVEHQGGIISEAICARRRWMPTFAVDWSP